MKQLILNRDFANADNLKECINVFLDELITDKNKNQQKILELCHVAKFLSFFENKYQIERILEGPDFIISSDNQRIGLEHQILVDNKSKEKEGFWNNIFNHIQQRIRQEEKYPNFLANIYINPTIDVKVNEKKQTIEYLTKIIDHFLTSNELIENKIIDRISLMSHTQISLNANLGGWCQKNISNDLLQNAILKKEKLADSYINSTGLKQWLLIVIGGVGESSYTYEGDISIDINSKFEKIYLLEDFYYRLFELK